MINGINHVTISVKNIEKAFFFYKEILKLKPVMKSSRSAYFLAGKIWIVLDKRKTFKECENYAHISFNVSKKLYKTFITEIKKNRVKEWHKNETEGDSLYILDNSGNKLEIHCSTLENRIKHGKTYYDKDTEWYV